MVVVVMSDGRGDGSGGYTSSAGFVRDIIRDFL